MALSLSDVKTAVNLEVANLTYKGAASETGDGVTAVYHIAPEGYYVVADTLTCTLDDVLTSAYTMDYDSGNFTFTAAPADAVDIYWQFDYVAWPDDVVEDSAVAAVDALFPYFYKNVTEDVTTDGTSLEYELTSAEVITAIFFQGTYDTADRRIKRDRWELLDIDGTPTLRFHSAPNTGTARVHCIQRCSIDDLPDRALAPLVSYCCYHLITQKMAPRTRADIAVATQGAGVLFPSQMKIAGDSFNMRFHLQLASVKMPPWSVR